MKENIVSFQVAKLAKEKGFEIETLYFYTKPNSKMFGLDEQGRSYSIKNISKKLYKCGEDTALSIKNVYLAPTQALLQKWIRETHKIYVTALPSYTDDSDNKKHYFELFYGKTLRLFGDKYSYFPTYEEALEVGLFEALNLIKNE